MQPRYPRTVFHRIVEQAMVYQCACPAQICRALDQMRELHKYRQDCLAESGTDRAVHERIAAAAEKAHAELEQCLEDVLRLERWSLETFEMPPERRSAPSA